MRGVSFSVPWHSTSRLLSAARTDAVLDAFDGSDDPILVVTQVCHSICTRCEA